MNEQVMPLGKYKGRSIAEIMVVDPQYIEWLTLQNWFVEKYKPTYNFIVQAGPSSEMTPEHNALQAKFLDDEFCLQVAKQAFSFWDQLKEPVVTLKKRLMETNGVDVHLEVYLGHAGYEHKHGITDPYIRDNHIDFNRSEPFCISIELKPSLGDDYPAVLRQINNQRDGRINQIVRMTMMANKYAQVNVDRLKFYSRFVLCYQTFSAEGATVEQVTKIFAEAGIQLCKI